jgi:hypothetical protein
MSGPAPLRTGGLSGRIDPTLRDTTQLKTILEALQESTAQHDKPIRPPVAMVLSGISRVKSTAKVS